MLQAYYQLTKPGIIYGNLVTAFAGFFLAAVHYRHFAIGAMIGMSLGLALVIAAACVCNNYIDRDIDKLMKRTSGRALVTKSITSQSALRYAVGLLLAGSLILLFLTNSLTLGLALFAFVVYVGPYSLSKPHTRHATLIGSIAGAVPIVAGYTALSGSFDRGALAIGLSMIFWQMPHFYAISLYRMADYKAAHIPVLSVARGISQTKSQIVVYLSAFVVASLSLSILGYTGYIYACIMAGLGLYWLWLSVHGFTTSDTSKWARKLFFVSLFVLLGFSVLLPLGALLP